MERQREASGTLGSRPINASVSDKRKCEVALPLPLLCRGLWQVHWLLNGNLQMTMKILAQVLNGAMQILLNEKTGEYSLYVHGDEFYTVSEESKMRDALRHSYRFGGGMCEKYQHACPELEVNF